MSTGIGPIDQALLPAGVRNGTPEQKQAYTTALGFEQMLVDQLSQELAATASTGSSSGDSSGSDGSGSDGSDQASGLIGGSDPASSAYAQLLPNALSTAVMSAGGLGVAQQLAGAISPSVGGAGGASMTPSAATGLTASSGASGAVSSATPNGGVGVAPNAASPRASSEESGEAADGVSGEREGNS